jgi:2,3-bisphosphoglycerate-dependent phosphoglycerate mutase
LTEPESADNGGKSPVLKHNVDDPHWHGWDHYEGNHQEEIPVFLSEALDERYYGNLQGFDKLEIAQSFGPELVHLWRRSFSVRPPSGESLEDTANRTIPYFQNRILAHLNQGDTVLVSAHGNSLRSVIMFLDHLSPEKVCSLELKTGIPIVYDIDAEGKVTCKRILDGQGKTMG